MKHYFAVDGNYGDAGEIVICDNTDEWTDEMWLYISECHEYDRVRIADCFKNEVPFDKVKEIFGE